MSLKDIPDLDDMYFNTRVDVVKKFYIPVLKQTVLYKRAVGFFSSSALLDVVDGIAGVVNNNGKILVIASPKLSAGDIEAINNGLRRREDIIQEAVLKELSDPKDEFEGAQYNLLANLIAKNILDIKIGLMNDSSINSLFHVKLGIVYDNENNIIAFSGSMNESDNAFEHNFDMFSVFKSWEPHELKRVKKHEDAFDACWNNRESGVHVFDFPKVEQAIIDKYRKNDVIDLGLDEEIVKKLRNNCVREHSEKGLVVSNRIGIPTIPPDFHIRGYQKEAVDSWRKHEYKGIFDMATGTGKTYTALAALVDIYEHNKELATIIVCPYQHLVEQWVEDISAFNIEPIIGYSSSAQTDWKERLHDAILDQKLNLKNKSFFLFICTNSTFNSEYVQKEMKKIKRDILLLVDEAHNFGAIGLRKLLDDKYKYRLALSATFERQRDDEGNLALKHFFGEKCIIYTLEKAIKEGFLTPYMYYPILVNLTEDELDDYKDISHEMSQHYITGKDGKIKLDQYGEILAIKRSRVVAAAHNKLDALTKEITKYVDKNYILVYCGAADIYNDAIDNSLKGETGIRQIDAVTNILGNKLGMRVAQFTANEDIEQRQIIKRQFLSADGLQALVAIKCLDEGVNIPGIRTAFILASTTNKKEYIQRRGRVLRKSEGKEFAEIFDFVTLPRKLDQVPSLSDEIKRGDHSLVYKEINRMEEFAHLSLNKMIANALIWKIKEAYRI